MTTNMGKIDRGLRLGIAVLLLVLVLGTNVLGSGILFWLALIVAVVFAVTALIGNCPAYSIIGVKTCRNG